jgi:hypothetical protein
MVEIAGSLAIWRVSDNRYLAMEIFQKVQAVQNVQAGPVV